MSCGCGCSSQFTCVGRRRGGGTGATGATGATGTSGDSGATGATGATGTSATGIFLKFFSGNVDAGVGSYLVDTGAIALAAATAVPEYPVAFACALAGYSLQATVAGTVHCEVRVNGVAVFGGSFDLTVSGPAAGAFIPAIELELGDTVGFHVNNVSGASALISGTLGFQS